jgi:hypothetical protein
MIKPSDTVPVCYTDEFLKARLRGLAYEAERARILLCAPPEYRVGVEAVAAAASGGDKSFQEARECALLELAWVGIALLPRP